MDTVLAVAFILLMIWLIVLLIMPKKKSPGG